LSKNNRAQALIPISHTQLVRPPQPEDVAIVQRDEAIVATPRPEIGDSLKAVRPGQGPGRVPDAGLWLEPSPEGFVVRDATDPSSAIGRATFPEALADLAGLIGVWMSAPAIA
jgi:hypothetical protein